MIQSHVRPGSNVHRATGVNGIKAIGSTSDEHGGSPVAATSGQGSSAMTSRRYSALRRRSQVVQRPDQPAAKVQTLHATTVALTYPWSPHMRPMTENRGVWLSTMVLLLLAAVAPTRPAQAQQATPKCGTTLDKTAAPDTVNKGDLVTVSLKISGTCPIQERKADVVLVIDRSRSMEDRTSPGGPTKLEAAKTAATSFVDSMDPALVRVGIIVFDAYVEELTYLTADQARLRAAIAAIPAAPGTNLVDSLDAGHRMVTSAGIRKDAQAVLVYMTDGKHNQFTGSPPPLSAIYPIIAKIHAAGITVHTIGLGQTGDIDEPLLRQIAGDPTHYHWSRTGDDLEGIFLGIAGIIKATVLFKSLTITDTVPGNMAYVPGSAQPAATWDGTARTLTWTFNSVPEAGHTLSFQVRPQQAGRHPTNVVATADYRDGFDNENREPFPVPQVTVLVPEEPAGCVCRITRQKVPRAYIDLALANPPSIMGWNQLQNPNKPGSPPYPTPRHDWPPNPRRTCLDLQNRAVPFHPLFNSVLWRAGCLEGPDKP